MPGLGLGFGVGLATAPNKPAAAPPANAILLEDGTNLLLESGDPILLEA